MTNTFGSRVTSPGGVTTSTVASFTTTAVGDVVVFYIGLGNGFATNKVTGLSASHIGSWQEIDVSGGVTDATLGERIQAWWGVVTSVATANITISYQAADATGNFAAWNFLSFHSDIASATWTLNQKKVEAASGASTASPALTPSASGCVYIGGICGFTGANGSTAGYTYTALDGFTDVTAYNLSAGTSSTSFAATQTGGTAYLRFGAVFKPTGPAGAPPPAVFGPYNSFH